MSITHVTDDSHGQCRKCKCFFNNGDLTSDMLCNDCNSQSTETTISQKIGRLTNETDKTIVRGEPRLSELLVKGSSLVFTQKRAECQRIEQLCASLAVPCISTRRRDSDRRLAVDMFHEFGPFGNAVLVSVVPTLITGVKVFADRIIWIGPHAVDDPIFKQAIGRVPMPWARVRPGLSIGQYENVVRGLHQFEEGVI